MEPWVWFLIAAGISVIVYVLYEKVFKDMIFPPGEETSSTDEAPTGDIITLTDEGTLLQKGTNVETYIEMPFLHKCGNRSSDPSYCSDITSTTEMNYAYDPIGGGLDDKDFFTTFDHVTNLCSDGTRDCLYSEKYDADRKLSSFTNSKGEDFVQKFIDDIWSGKVDFNRELTIDGKKTTFKDKILTMVEYDRNTGIMYLLRPGVEKIRMVPGMKTIHDGPIDGALTVPTGMFILYIIFYYHANNLPKPTIKLDLKSEIPFGELYEQTYIT